MVDDDELHDIQHHTLCDDVDGRIHMSCNKDLSSSLSIFFGCSLLSCGSAVFCY
jgi:hypothetical protein